jgi:hypothetical protein
MQDRIDELRAASFTTDIGSLVSAPLSILTGTNRNHGCGC